MDEYTPNSHKFKEEVKRNSDERKKVEKVVTGAVKTKKNNTRKFADVFISEDISKVKNFIFMDVLIPNVKRLISEMITNSVDMILYGESGRNRKRSTNTPNVSYRDYYDSRRDDYRYQSEPKSRASVNNFDDFIFESRADANEVLSRMSEIIETYSFVKVSDFYELAGVKDIPYTANRYGWTNIASAEVLITRDGFVIKLPRAVVID